MISIIITSINQYNLNKIKLNIPETIGAEYELIVIDNRENRYSIFQAYNLGVSKAKGDILCFAHEDILFHTNDWGRNVEKHFENDKNLGMIGVVGGDYYPKMPAPWWSNEEVNTHYVNLIQHWRQSVSERNYRKLINEKTTRDYNNPNNLISQQVVAVDGLWFCITKEVSTKVKFDEETFDGFHFYDADISMQVQDSGYKINVIFDVLIEHFSPGSLSKGWFISAQIFSEKWRKKLPVGVENLSVNNVFEIKTLLTYVYWMQSVSFSEKEIKSAILKLLPYLEKENKIIDYWQLKLWSIFGYQLSRYPMYLIKKII